tara:strand:+ start:584 stop:1168 length:585 start_codon:yes stop_codon:yes gene_type:complete
MQQDKLNILSIDCDYVITTDNLKDLVKMYLKYVDKVDLKQITFSQIHANIFNVLDPLWRKGHTIDIVNIDHHHDIFGLCPTLKNGFNSSNWLGYYMNKPNFIKSAYWLANYESVHQNPTYDDDAIIVSHNIEEVILEKFDYIFVCSSPKFCNEYGKICYEILVEITKSNKKCDKFDFTKSNILNHEFREIIPNN